MIISMRLHATKEEIDHVRERGENSKRRPRDDGSPLEPELEEIAVDQERARSARQ